MHERKGGEPHINEYCRLEIYTHTETPQPQPQQQARSVPLSLAQPWLPRRADCRAMQRINAACVSQLHRYGLGRERGAKGSCANVPLLLFKEAKSLNSMQADIASPTASITQNTSALQNIPLRFQSRIECVSVAFSRGENKTRIAQQSHPFQVLLQELVTQCTGNKLRCVLLNS